MMVVPFLRSALLDQPFMRDVARHAFFTRQGGISAGVYASLNGGVGSRDVPDHVQHNRAVMADVLCVPATHLLVPYQIHSADVAVVEGPWAVDARPRVDGLVTARRGVALGVTGADCGMVLCCDAQAGVIGAAHAGWKGALGGVIEALVAAMEAQGAHRGDIYMALGPMIGPNSYEVGDEFVARFDKVEADYARFFKPAARVGHFMFDLPGFIEHRAGAAGIGHFDNLCCDTYADEARFYSYRRSVHRHEDDYGRLVSAIALV
jgi:YfiH family protein